MKISNRYVATAVTAVGGLWGCGAESGEAPAVDLDGVEEQATLTHVNGDGTWTATALQPTVSGALNHLVRAKATFTGPSGTTRKMGVCGLKLGRTYSGAIVQCTDVSQCNGAPSSIPSNGYRYCTSPDQPNSGPKYCYFRPGGETTHCAGSPALGFVAIAPGTYTTPTMANGLKTEAWISYACFEGCLGAVTDPSGSSTALVVPAPCGGGPICGSKCC